MDQVKFEVGKTYHARSICDHSTIFKFKVVKRTEKSVWVRSQGASTIRRRMLFVSTRGNKEIEAILPCGSYSMAPTLLATEESED